MSEHLNKEPVDEVELERHVPEERKHFLNLAAVRKLARARADRIHKQRERRARNDLEQDFYEIHDPEIGHPESAVDRVCELGQSESRREESGYNDYVNAPELHVLIGKIQSEQENG